MAQTSPKERLEYSSANRTSKGAAAIAFDLTILATIGVWFVAAIALPNDHVLPLVSGFLFLLACSIALLALCHRRHIDHRQLTYWDVAGALTLIGICAGALVDPDQLVRLVAGAQSES
jgi:heme A synthase